MRHHNLPPTAEINGRTYNLDWAVNDHMSGWTARLDGIAPAGMSLYDRDMWGMDHPVDGCANTYVDHRGNVTLTVNA